MTQEIQARVHAANAQGWECVGITNVQASVAGSAGCFGIGATLPYSHSVCLLLFRRGM